jgi:hypothetical protein
LANLKTNIGTETDEGTYAHAPAEAPKLHADESTWERRATEGKRGNHGGGRRDSEQREKATTLTAVGWTIPPRGSHDMGQPAAAGEPKFNCHLSNIKCLMISSDVIVCIQTSALDDVVHQQKHMPRCPNLS